MTEEIQPTAARSNSRLDRRAERPQAPENQNVRQQHVPHYRVLYSTAYIDDYKRVDPFERPRLRNAVALLVHQAETATRNRRPLEATITWCPEATWQLRVGDYRVLYRLEGSDVFVLRVRFKGSSSTEGMGS